MSLPTGLHTHFTSAFPFSQNIQLFPAPLPRWTPGGPYEVFAGRECARALAIMKVDAAECNSQLEDCSEKQLKTLQDWIIKFNAKYPVVGQVQQ